MANEMSKGGMKTFYSESDPDRRKWTSWLDKRLLWVPGSANDWIKNESGGRVPCTALTKASWAVKGKVFLPGFMLECGLYQHTDSSFLRAFKFKPDREALQLYIATVCDMEMATRFQEIAVLNARKFDLSKYSARHRSMYDKCTFGRGSGFGAIVHKGLIARGFPKDEAELAILITEGKTSVLDTEKIGFHRTAKKAWLTARRE